MTKDVIVVGPEDPIELAARKMKKYNISSLPVVDENQFGYWNCNNGSYKHLIAGN